MPAANRGAEPYSAWFGDARAGILYFGLSPFWTLWWRTGGDPRADLAQPGDLLIGRFDLEAERFLTPLRVGGIESRARASVWDVLAHSNGRIYFTTYFERVGSVAADGSDLRVFSGIGTGFNELWEGPGGHVYVTRYSDAPRDVAAQRYGAVVELTEEGSLVREIRFEKSAGSFTAPKSVAVDPVSGEIWLNTDTFQEDGGLLYETLRLASDGRVLERQLAPPELQFMSFDREGRGWFAELVDGDFRLRIEERGRRTHIPLGRREGVDFVQDIKFSAEGHAAIAFWSGRVTLVRRAARGYAWWDLELPRPRECERFLVYTAVPYADRVYATLYCGATIVRAGAG